MKDIQAGVEATYVNTEWDTRQPARLEIHDITYV